LLALPAEPTTVGAYLTDRAGSPVCRRNRGDAAVESRDSFFSSLPAKKGGAAMANTEDHLIAAIESTLQAAHLQCQPYFLELAEHPAGEPTSAAIAAAVSRGAVRRQFFY
jgi:hypothetical protein